MNRATLRDSGKHYAAKPARIARPCDEEQLRAVLAEARRQGQRISVMGAGKSQGGLILGDGIVISTDRMARVLQIDAERLTARVEPGVTWDMLRERLAGHGLAACATQSYGVFTVGGSVAVNAHGRDVDVGVLAQTVESLRVMRADGSVVETSREQEAELFSLAIGGFGLFGIVTAITLRLTPNDVYRRSCVAAMPSDEYPRYFASRVAADADVRFHDALRCRRGPGLAAPVLRRLPARRRRASAEGLTSIAASSSTAGGWYRVLDAALHLHPVSPRERCGHATCRRAAFLWGELIRHANVDEASHARMPQLLGDAAVLPFVQMTRAIRSGRIADAQGRDVYLADAARWLRLPITFVHGSDNRTLHEGSTRLTFEHLVSRNGPAMYRHHVAEGFGHMDCLIGRDASKRVYPLIGEHLDRVAAVPASPVPTT